MDRRQNIISLLFKEAVRNKYFLVYEIDDDTYKIQI